MQVPRRARLCFHPCRARFCQILWENFERQTLCNTEAYAPEFTLVGGFHAPMAQKLLCNLKCGRARAIDVSDAAARYFDRARSVRGARIGISDYVSGKTWRTRG